MKKGILVGIVVLVLLVAGFLMTGVYLVNLSNREVTLRTTIEAKQRDNTSEFDNMWKKISQVAQVTDKQRQALIDIFKSYAEARHTGGDKQLFTWVRESVPNVDTSIFENLQNILTASRDGFTQRQKELLDLNREHQLLLHQFPSGMILSVLGRKEIPITIITSTRTEQTFLSGKDDDVEVFKK